MAVGRQPIRNRPAAVLQSVGLRNTDSPVVGVPTDQVQNPPRRDFDDESERWLVVPAVVWWIPRVCRRWGELSRAQQTAVADVAGRVDLIKAVNRKIWDYAEVGLEETRSSALLQKHLKQNGFKVKSGVAGMPTAFVASFGSGKPVIGILAEYDALPGMSQKVEPVRAAVRSGQPGHACGHSGLGSGALGAALAVKAAMDRHKIKGTIRLYGTPAEETVIGKVYMLLDGQFDDLDVCLHWHPSSRNGAWAGTSKALVSVKFSFDGTAAHASGSPESGRSALDAVELMNVGVNYMREHVKEDARMHYVITNGGGAPNVVPPVASVWYYIRADDHVMSKQISSGSRTSHGVRP